jgi:class 3 adenylate cyclase
MAEGRVERRLAAIVAADVAGYSRLMGLDEVGTARTLREHRKVTDALVAKHGGRLVKTKGNGVFIRNVKIAGRHICTTALGNDSGLQFELSSCLRLLRNAGDQ